MCNVVLSNAEVTGFMYDCLNLNQIRLKLYSSMIPAFQVVSSHTFNSHIRVYLNRTPQKSCQKFI